MIFWWFRKFFEFINCFQIELILQEKDVSGGTCDKDRVLYDFIINIFGKIISQFFFLFSYFLSKFFIFLVRIWYFLIWTISTLSTRNITGPPLIRTTKNKLSSTIKVYGTNCYGRLKKHILIYWHFTPSLY